MIARSSSDPSTTPEPATGPRSPLEPGPLWEVKTVTFLVGTEMQKDDTPPAETQNYQKETQTFRPV